MAQDEDDPIRKRRWLEPLVLDPLGVNELHAYIEALKDEIARGLQQGRSAWLPGLPPSTQPRGVHVATLTNCISGLDC